MVQRTSPEGLLNFIEIYKRIDENTKKKLVREGIVSWYNAFYSEMRRISRNPPSEGNIRHRYDCDTNFNYWKEKLETAGVYEPKLEELYKQALEGKELPESMPIEYRFRCKY